MGYEYTLNFEIDDPKDVAALLMSLPFFSEVKSLENKDQFFYRSPENSGSLPNGLAQIEPRGVYFCDYGEGQAILQTLVFRVSLSYGKLELIDHSD